MATPLVSIIVPCYKHAAYLPDALDSVLDQTYSNWECIIVNDASPDNTVEVANGYTAKDKRFILLDKQINEGLSAARNSGIRQSGGIYILPLDADDKLAPTYVEKSVDVLLEAPGTKVVYTDVIVFGDKTGEVVRPEFKLRDLCYNNIFQPCAMYRRSDFDRTVGYRINMKYGYEDWDFWFQIVFEDKQVHHIHEPLFYCRVKEISMVRELSSHSSKEQLMRKTIRENNPAQFERWAPELVGKQKLGLLPAVKRKMKKMIGKRNFFPGS